MLHVATKVDESTEDLVHRVIGCITVHRELGPGLVEPIYHRAVELELGAAGIPFEREKRFKVMYRGKCLLINFNAAVLKDGIKRIVL